MTTTPTSTTAALAGQIARFARDLAEEELMAHAARLEIVVHGAVDLEPLLAAEAALAEVVLPGPQAELMWAIPNAAEALRLTVRVYDPDGRLLLRRDLTPDAAFAGRRDAGWATAGV